MRDRKTYGQFCGLARALDRVGDRWTLLVIRQLMIDDAAFRQLQAALPGVAPNLLADRLRALVADGIIGRSEAPRRSKAVRYSLTPLGRSLEPAVLELIRWGAAWMVSGPGSDHVDPQWGVLALRALLTDASITFPRGALHLDLEGVDLVVSVSVDGRAVGAGRPARARARVATTLPAVLAVASGTVTVDAAGLTVTGDATFARAALAPITTDPQDDRGLGRRPADRPGPGPTRVRQRAARGVS
jgi:DNA-binding HxlR family transcriptional regulator